MPYGTLADLVVAVHLLFVAFAAGGALLVLWRAWLVWLHVPAALWAVGIELGGWICPLTPLERRLRALAGEPAYGEGFVAHYLVPVLYPPGLTRPDQIALAVALVAVNALIYGYVIRRRRRVANGR